MNRQNRNPFVIGDAALACSQVPQFESSVTQCRTMNRAQRRPKLNQSLKYVCLALSIGCIHATAADAQAEIVVYYSDWPGMTATVNGQAQGPAIDILKAITVHGGPNFKLVNTPWVRALDYVNANPQSAIVPITRTPSRENKYRWLAALFQYRVVLVTEGKPAPASIEAAKDLRIGIVAGGALDQENVLDKLGFTKVEKVHSDSLNARKLHQGHLDAWAVDDTTAGPTYLSVGLNPARLRFGATIGEPKWAYLAANPNFPEAQANAINQAMKKAQAGNKLDEILQQYQAN